jgi:hypothetical protein
LEFLMKKANLYLSLLMKRYLKAENFTDIW